MRGPRLLAVALALLIGGTLGIVAAGHGPLESTSAAWADRTSVSAVVKAGTWSKPPVSTCVAYGPNGKALTGCVVSGITYNNWGTPGAQTRNYYINFQTPQGTRSVSFDVDLTTATGNASSWSWSTASVLSGAQFTPRDGWNCSQLPRLRGTGVDWQTTTIYFQAVERLGSTPPMCS